MSAPESHVMMDDMTADANQLSPFEVIETSTLSGMIAVDKR